MTSAHTTRTIQARGSPRATLLYAPSDHDGTQPAVVLGQKEDWEAGRGCVGRSCPLPPTARRIHRPIPSSSRHKEAPPMIQPMAWAFQLLRHRPSVRNGNIPLPAGSMRLRKPPYVGAGPTISGGGFICLLRGPPLSAWPMRFLRHPPAVGNVEEAVVSPVRADDVFVRVAYSPLVLQNLDG